MYLYHFGLKELPFTLTPNTRLFCELPTFRAAIDLAYSAIECGEGIVKVIGEVGTGKTMLATKLTQRLEKKHVVIHLKNPQITPELLYEKIIASLSAKGSSSINEGGADIEERVQAAVKNSSTLILLVDEAQSLSHRTLEAIRFLSNIETEKDKLVQILFLGQPEFDERLATNELRQLEQRIAFSYQLQALTLKEVEAYIQYRLEKSCLYPGTLKFTPKALKALYRYSSGLPRKINVLCHRALMIAYSENTTTIDKNTIVQAFKENATKKKHWLKSVFFRFGISSLFVASLFPISWFTV